MILIFAAFYGCKDKAVEKEADSEYINKIVLISLNAPASYLHVIKQDSLGKKLKDSTGPKLYYDNSGFSYLDKMNIVRTWLPKAGVKDTLVIECYSDYLELSTKNPFTSINQTFLVKNSDTIVFSYENNIPNAEIINREVNDVQLNYNNYRLKELFNNKYTSHSLIGLNLVLKTINKDYDKESIEYYQEAEKDYLKEVELLDSLYQSNTIAETDYNYRKSSLNILMLKNKRPKDIQKWLALKSKLNHNEILEKEPELDLLSKGDSLMKFSFFRDYINYTSEYDLSLIEEYNIGSGSFYRDSRIRFDSILKDERFDQTAKDFLLTETFKDIAVNFRVKDKEKYFKKLQQNTHNPELVKQLEREHNLNFETSDMLILTSQENDTTTFSDMLQKNKGKWLYIDFWASWCGPCKRTMPESVKLKKALKDENVKLIYLSLNDKREKWKQAIKNYNISKSDNYFIENGMVSKVIENLGIKTLPHYLIYNPKGELVNGYAKRPGDGAKSQLTKYIKATEQP